MPNPWDAKAGFTPVSIFGPGFKKREMGRVTACGYSEIKELDTPSDPDCGCEGTYFDQIPI